MRFSKFILVLVLTVTLVYGSSYANETSQPTNEPATIPTTEPTTEPTIDIIIEEEPPLGLPVNFDQIYEESQVFEENPMLTTEDTAEIILEGEIPLAVALPQTGQLSPDIFLGIGSLVSLAGLWIKRRK